MTLLTICQNAAAMIPVAQPSTVIGNADTTAMALLAAAQEEGNELARRPGGGWVKQQIQYLFSTVSLTPITGTVLSGSAIITGLSSTAAITGYRFAASGTGIPLNATVIAKTASTVTLDVVATASGSVSVTFSQFAYPVPSDFQRPIDNTMWDRTRAWKMRGPYSPQQWQFVKSSIFTQATIERQLRFLYVNGTMCLCIQPVPTDNGSTLVYEYVSNAWCTDEDGTLQTKWTADTDVALMDEFLMQKGVGWRVRRMLGLAYDEEYASYQQLVEKAIAHDGGAETLSMAPSNTDGFLGGPLTNITDFGYG